MIRWTVRILVALVLLGAAGLVALVALGQTPGIPRSEAEAKHAVAPSELMTFGDGTRVHFRDRGPRSAPAIVLVPGFTDSLLSFEAVATSLAESHRVVSLDLPGHGLTGPIPSGDYSQDNLARTVLELTRLLGIERFAIAGNSMGGAVALRASLLAPGRVTKVMLLCAGGITDPANPEPPMVVRLLRLPLVGPWLATATPRTQIEGYLARVVADPAKLDPAFVQAYSDLVLVEGGREARQKIMSVPFGEFLLDGRLGEVRVPVLVLWGAKDPILSMRMADVFARDIPQAEKLVFDDVGHMPQLEAPERTAQALAAFMAR